MRLIEYTKNCRKIFKPNNGIKVVIGNSSGDMDSFLSCLLYSYFTYRKTNAIVFPIVSFKRDELKLRGDIVYAISKVGLQDEDFIYWDECKEITNIKVSLVDHNAIDNDWLKSEGVHKEVVDIIDHHVDSGENTTESVSGKMEIEVSGSCSSLVLGGNENLIQDDEKEFCLSALLVDTGGMKRKVETFDSQVWEKMGGNSNMVKYGEKLIQKRKEVTGLKVYDLLRKDWKQWGELGIASVAVGVDHWQETSKQSVEEMEKDVKNWMKERGVKKMAVMTSWEEAGELRRELGLVEMKVGEVVKGMLQLQQRPDNLLEGIEWWEQKAVGKSRKQVAPLLLQCIR